jgi:hypothetical protein
MKSPRILLYLFFYLTFIIIIIIIIWIRKKKWFIKHMYNQHSFSRIITKQNTLIDYGNA